MAETKKMFCSCEHKFQDEKNGDHIRVFNIAKSASGAPKWRCTVCGNTKN